MGWQFGVRRCDHYVGCLRRVRASDRDAAENRLRVLRGKLADRTAQLVVHRRTARGSGRIQGNNFAGPLARVGQRAQSAESDLDHYQHGGQ